MARSPLPIESVAVVPGHIAGEHETVVKEYPHFWLMALLPGQLLGYVCRLTVFLDTPWKS